MTSLRQTLRTLAHAPGFTAVVVVTLAIAIGANSAIFSVLNGVVLKPLDYDRPEQLVMVWESNPSQGLDQAPVSGATFVDWRERSQTFQSFAAFRYRGFTLTQDGVPRRIASAQVSPNLFGLLGERPVLGRAFRPEEEQPGNERLVIISNGAWQNRFGGDGDIVGKTIPLDGEAYEVVGVMPPGFTFPVGDDEVEVWSPLTLSLEDLPSRPHRMYSAIGRLTDGANLEGARTEMEAISARIAAENPESNEGWSVTLMSAEDQLLGDTSTTVWLLFGAVSLVLVIGCVNVANLLLVRSGELSRTVAVHAAFGATPADLVKRSISEGVVLGAIGGVAGLVLAWASIGVLRGVLPAGFPRLDNIHLDGTVVLFTAVVSVLAGVLFSLGPALRNLRPDIVGVLQESTRGASLGRTSRRVADLMISAEVALALVLTVGAGLLLRSYAELSSVDPGYRTEGVVAIAVELPPSRYSGGAQQSQFFNDLMQRVRGIPGVAEVGGVSYLPMSSVGTEFDMPFTVEGLDAESPSQRPTAEYRAVFPGYFEAMGIELVAGRMIDDIDGTDGSRVALVNETVVRRYFSSVDPIGQMIGVPMVGQVEVVGVVADIRHDGIGVEANPEMFVPYMQLPMSAMHVVLHVEDDPTDVIGAVRAAVTAIDPEQPVTAVSRMEDLVSDSIAPSRFNMALLLGLALCALALAMVGVYGVVSYSVSRRTQEIGVRIAMGADAGSAVGLVLRQAGRVVALGALAGVAVSIASAGAVEHLLYGVEPLDPATFVAVSLGLVAVAMLAAAIPAMRAARIDPVSALRGD